MSWNTPSTHLTLGKLTDLLERFDATKTVKLSGGDYPDPDGAHSYRGYYEDISFETSGEEATVGQFVYALNEAHGETHTGWKGGEFTMHGHTDVWFSFSGSCSGIYPVGVELQDDVVVILTANEEW